MSVKFHPFASKQCLTVISRSRASHSCAGYSKRELQVMAALTRHCTIAPGTRTIFIRNTNSHSRTLRYCLIQCTSLLMDPAGNKSVARNHLAYAYLCAQVPSETKRQVLLQSPARTTYSRDKSSWNEDAYGTWRPTRSRSPLCRAIKRRSQERGKDPSSPTPGLVYSGLGSSVRHSDHRRPTTPVLPTSSFKMT